MIKIEVIDLESVFCCAPAKEKLAEEKVKALKRPGRGRQCFYTINKTRQCRSPYRQALT